MRGTARRGQFAAEDQRPELGLHFGDGRDGAHARTDETDKGDGRVGGDDDVSAGGVRGDGVGGIEEGEFLSV